MVIKTFGELKYAGKKWVLSCEPHVQVRLKRVFERADKREHKALSFADTLENARELAWFFERYPMAMDAKTRARLHERASEHIQRENDVAMILGEGYVPREFKLAIQPRPYQRVAAELYLRRGHLLLADDVGLGKTCSAICTLADPATLPALVVTLTHLPPQWRNELARFAPQLRVHILKKATPYEITESRKSRRAKEAGEGELFPDGCYFPDVIVTSYSKLIGGWATELSGRVKSVIFDECQELRHMGTARHAAASHIAEGARYVMGLSATPIYNGGGEMYSVMQCIEPGALGTAHEFTREWCSGSADGMNEPVEKGKIADPRAFGAWLRDQGIMLRRTRAEVGRELPELTRVAHHIDVDLAHIEKVERGAAELARVILQQGGMGIDKMRSSEELDWKLRQATGVAKAGFVADFVKLLVESGEKVVLYGWHHDVYNLWKERLADLKPAFYTGEQSTTQKVEARRRFVEGETPVLIMSLRAGAGLDGLQGVCRNVVFGELDWSPMVHEQAIGRVHRDGQAEQVMAYFLVAEAGSDPIVADVLGLKKSQIRGILDLEAQIEHVDAAGQRMKKLARALLERLGLPVPEEAPAAAGAPPPAASPVAYDDDIPADL
jgi:SNF2 family DNA or RNA helicase